MTEQTKNQPEAQVKEQKQESPEAKSEKPQPKAKLKEIVRILNTDLLGESKLYYSLARIKGVSWNLSNIL